MATASKILIRLTKFSSKISTVVDATDSFNANNSFYQDLSGWDLAVVQVVNPGTTIYFKTTNDDGSVTGDLLPAPEVPLYWMPVLGVDLLTKSDVSSISGTGLVSFGIIGKYLQLIAAGATTTTTTTIAPTGDFITTEGSDPIITEDDNNLITE
jgi:hypothetical protein